MKKIATIITLASLAFLVGGCKDKTTTKNKTTSNTTKASTKASTRTTSTKKITAMHPNIVRSWQNKARYTISFQGYSYTIGRSIMLDEFGEYMVDNEGNLIFVDEGLKYIDYDYQATNAKIQRGQVDDSIVVNITSENRELLFNELTKSFGYDVIDTTYFNYEALLEDILKDAGEMKNRVEYDLTDYLSENWTDSIIDKIALENLSKEKVEDLLEFFGNKEIEIKPRKETTNGKGFSLVEFFSQDEYKGLKSSDISIIATGIASVIRNTSFTVLTMNQGYVSDRYYAYDDFGVRVNIKDDTDFVIDNPETTSYYVIIEKGEKGQNDTLGLNFTLVGCKFVNTYSSTKNIIEESYNISYDAYASDFTYDEDDPMMGIDSEYQGGVYYKIYWEGEPTYHYIYTRTTTFIDGCTSTTEVYPTEILYVGRDEWRMWKKINPDE